MYQRGMLNILMIVVGLAIVLVLLGYFSHSKPEFERTETTTTTTTTYGS